MAGRTSYTGPLSPEFALLGFLAQGETYGYELQKKLLVDLGQVWHLSLSQVYNILARLESHGFVAGEMHQQDKLPPRRLITLTPRGRERFETWLTSTNRTSVRLIRLEFLTRLYFARLRGAAFAHQLIDEQLADARMGLAELRRLYLDIPPDQLVNRLSVELRLQQLESILVWLENCHQAIDIAAAPPTESESS